MIKRIAVVIIGVCTAMVLLEISLRVLGMLFSSRPGQNEGQNAPGDCTILCIGDSFVFGIGAPSDKSFPRQLEVLLNNRSGNKRFRVINKGEGGRNSSQVLKGLPGNLRDTKPDYVLLLAGSNNQWNYGGYYSFREGKTLRAKMANGLYHVRVFKLAKLLSMNINSRISEVRFDRMFFLKGGNKQKEEKISNDLLKSNAYCARGWDLIGLEKYQEATKCFEEGMRLAPSNSANHNGLSRICRELGDCNEAVRWLQKAIEVEKTNLWNYNDLGRLYLQMNRHREALLAFEEGIRAAPDRADNMNYGALTSVIAGNDAMREEVLAFLYKLQKDTKTSNPLMRSSILLAEETSGSRLHKDIIEWIEHDIEEIVRISKEEGVKTVIIGYPESSDGRGEINSALKKIADMHSLSYVDNAAVFRVLLHSNAREKYFVQGDCHCNANGYGVIAGNIFDKLKKELNLK